MKSKMKMSVFAVVMCTIMMVTSLTVFAKERTEEVPITGASGFATIGISADGLYAWADTRGSSANNSPVSTRITGNCDEPVTRTGYPSVDISCDITPFNSASSYHMWTARTYTMYITK